MSIAQALAIAAAALVMAGGPWSLRAAQGRAELSELTARAEFITARATSRFSVAPDGHCMKRSFAVL